MKQEIKIYFRGEQTLYIRKMITEGIKRENLVRRLAGKFERSESWANGRMWTYENYYGQMGINDPKLNKGRF